MKSRMLVLLFGLVGQGAFAQIANLSVSPGQSSLSVPYGTTAELTFTISNSGDETLYWDISDIFYGDPVSFSKPNFGDPKLEQNQDRISDHVWLTRKSSQGLFNAQFESAYGEGSPVGTLWAFSKTIEAVGDELEYTNWSNAVYGSPPSQVGNVVSMYSQEDQRYFDFNFTSWQSNASGGGFSYTRREVPVGHVTASAYMTELGSMSSTQVTFYIDTETLASTSHDFEVILANTDNGQTVTIPIELTVTGGTSTLVAEPLEFDDTFIGYSTTKELVVENGGPAELVITNITSDLTVCTPSVTALTIPGFSSSSITVTFEPELAQEYSGTLTFISNDEASPTEVGLYGIGLIEPEIAVDVESLSENLEYNTQSETYIVTISNDGGSSLNWSAGLVVPDSEVTFSKSDYADWTLPENQDRITPKVWITRQDQQGIFNIKQESSFQGNGDEGSESPSGTLWANGTTLDILYEGENSYDYWLYSFNGPSSILEDDFSMKTEDNRYFDIDFHSWTPNANGGGFSYTRTEVPGWFLMSDLSGAVEAGQTQEIEVQFGANVVAGSYQANLILYSNDPDLPELIVPLTLSVTGNGVIALTNTEVFFDEIFIGTSQSVRVEIENIGGDVLNISDISSDNSVFTVSPTMLTVPAQSSEFVEITFTPVVDGEVTGTLTITSDDPESPSVTIDLFGFGKTYPNIVATFGEFVLDVTGGEPLTESISIENTQGVNLDWTFQANLTSILSAINTNFANITSVIPDVYTIEYDGDYYEEEEGYIDDGGGDMYDDGNYLYTDLSEENGIRYSGGEIADGSDYFGEGSQYFTLELNGLFVLAAELNGANAFEIRGGLGADGSGSVEASVIEVEYLGTTYQGFVKRVYNAGDPSVNHLIILPATEGERSQDYSTDTDNDYHRVEGLDSRIMFYLLYSGFTIDEEGEGEEGEEDGDGTYIDDEATESIMLAFLQSIPDNATVPDFISIEPISGSLAAGNSQTAVVTIDPADVPEGITEMNLILGSNDPDEANIYIPITFLNNIYPVVKVNSTSFAFGSTFVGYENIVKLEVTNEGSEQLEVTFSSNNDDFGVGETMLSIAPEATIEVDLVFHPITDGEFNGTISMSTNARDNELIEISVSGVAVIPPAIVVTPESFDINLFPGETFNGQITVENTQGINLDWVMSSTLDLVSISAKLNNIQGITNTIPEAYAFEYDGETDYIDDGGDDMYDGGNFLITNFYGEFDQESEEGGTGIPYTSGELVDGSAYFGSGTQYFTAELDGLFVLAAELNEVDFFEINGGLGADGDGSVETSVVEVEFLGETYQGFVKRVYNAGDPSVNHVILLPKSDDHVQEYSTDTDSDFHRVSGISSNVLFYVLYAGYGGDEGSDGVYIGDGDVLSIMEAFFEASTALPSFLGLSSAQSSTTAGVTETIDVTINAEDMEDVFTEFDLVVKSNDPVNPTVTIPFTVHVSDSYVWNGSSWNSGSTPPPNKDLIFKGDFTLVGSMEASTTSVVSGVTLTIGSGADYTDNTGFDNEGTVIIESGGSFIPKGDVTGTDYRIQRNVVGDGGYSVVGSPVVGASVNDNSADFVFGFDGDNYVITSGSEVMTAGKGYFFAHMQSDPVVEFVGTPNTGDQAFDLPSADKFHLVANPYTAPLDRAAFVSANNTPIDGNIYLWDDGGTNDGALRAGGFVTVNSIGITSGTAGLKGKDAFNGSIGTAQGFYVFSNSASPVTFSATMIDPAEGQNSDDGFYRLSSTNPPMLRMSLSDGTYHDDLVIAFMKGATEGKDQGLDALKLYNPHVSFFSKSGEYEYAIQVLPELESEITIPIGYQIPEGVSQITLSLDDLTEIPTDLSVFLLDRLTGQSYDLVQNSSLSFGVAENGNNDRFEIAMKYTKALAHTPVNALLKAHATEQLVTLFYPKPGIHDVVVYNLNGAIIHKEKLDFNEGVVSIDNWNLRRDKLYIIRIGSQHVKVIVQ